MKKKTYTRLVSGKILTANIISISESKVVYNFDNSKTVMREYTPLFLSVFTKVN